MLTTYIQCPRAPEEVIRSVGLQLQAVVSHRVDAGNQAHTLRESSECSQPLSLLSGSHIVLYGSCKRHSLPGGDTGRISSAQLFHSFFSFQYQKGHSI